MVPEKLTRIRFDLEVILACIDDHSKVLDLGCGEGELLEALIQKKECVGHGVEIHDRLICSCIEKGVPVIHGDIDEGLGDYPDQFFDFVVLSRTLQVVHKPDTLLKEIVRVGRMGIVSFPNFGHLFVRSQLFFEGRMPVTKTLPFEWYNTPNIHLLTVKDFKTYCKKKSLKIINQIYIGKSEKGRIFINLFPNLFAEQAVFIIQKADTGL